METLFSSSRTCPIKLSDYDIEKPRSAVVLSVEDNASMEFQIFFKKQLSPYKRPTKRDKPKETAIVKHMKIYTRKGDDGTTGCSTAGESKKTLHVLRPTVR